jgi:aryl-alcohol dehydrogenase (NADP+)
MTYGSSKWREWVIDEEASRPLIRQALESGINFFDTADVYSRGVSEEILGRALKDFGANREHIVVATKLCGPMGSSPNEVGLSRKHVMHAIDNSLRRLGMDHVDLYQIHRFDPSTPIEETVDALHDVVKSGKVRYIGASSMYAWQFSKYLHTQERLGKTKFVSMQNFYNLIYREEEREMLPLCRDQGIGVIRGARARGFLARSRDANTEGTTRSNGCPPADPPGRHCEILDAVTKIARERGVPIPQVTGVGRGNGLPPDRQRHQDDHLDAALPSIDLSKGRTGRCRRPISQKNCWTPDLGRSKSAPFHWSPLFASAGGTRLRLAASPRQFADALVSRRSRGCARLASRPPTPRHFVHCSAGCPAYARRTRCLKSAFEGGEMVQAYRALRYVPRAQETLYRLAELPPVSRYFLARRRNGKRLPHASPVHHKASTGVQHFSNRPGMLAVSPSMCGYTRRKRRCRSSSRCRQVG